MPDPSENSPTATPLKEVFHALAGAGNRLDLNLLSNSVRIAVVGASRSGKTVLLTSLIDHLHNHDPRRFRLQPAAFSGKEFARISGYDILEVKKPLAEFPFETFRKSLIDEASWPRKTRDTYQYRLKVYRDDSGIDRIKDIRFSTRLSFLDFPGERIADAPITGMTYAEWSDYALENLPVGKAFAGLVEAFKTISEKAPVAGEAVLAAYKRILAERLGHFHTAITPSTFSLSPEGTTPETGTSREDLVRDRLTGLERGKEFCPLTARAREENPELVRTFERAYRVYQATLVRPLYKALADCDRLCLLVNIPEILQSGVEAYNDHVELMKNVLAFCAPRRGIPGQVIGRLTKTLGKVFIDDRYRPGGIEKAAFVATQADRVCPSDVDRMLKLVDALKTNCTRNLPHLRLQMKAFTCVAVQATRPAGTGNLLRGRLMGGGGKVSERSSAVEEFPVSRLPDEWPAGWNPEDFVFPDVWPRFSQNRNYPPEQIGLDRVFNYLTS